MIVTLAETYYIRLGGKAQGPFSVEELHRRAKRGRFSRLWNVSEDGVAWHRASEFPELFPPPALSPSLPQPIEQGGGEPYLAELQPLAEFDDYPLLTDMAEQGELAAEPRWFYLLDGQEQGSASFSELQLMAIAPDDLVWTEGMEDWVEARHVAGLVPASGVGPGIVGLDEFQTRKIAPMAMASFLFSLAGLSCLFFLGSVLAVVLGHIALQQVKKSDGASRGLVVAGLSLGYVGLFVGTVAGLVLLVRLLT